MSERDTLHADEYIIPHHPRGKVSRRRFTGGHAALAVVALIIAAAASTCANLPDDYSQLRSHAATTEGMP